MDAERFSSAPPRAVLTLLPDYDDPDPTAMAIPAYADDRVDVRASHLRLRTPDPEPAGEDVRGALCDLSEGVLALTLSLAQASEALAWMPYDASARAAADVLARRLFDATDVRDALRLVLEQSLNPALAPLLERDAPLPPYLKGVAIWCDGVVDALAVVALELRTLRPDWIGLRRRLEEASQFHFRGLVGQVRAHIDALRQEGYDGPKLRAVAESLEELFFTSRLLAETLEARFG